MKHTPGPCAPSVTGEATALAPHHHGRHGPGGAEGEEQRDLSPDGSRQTGPRSRRDGDDVGIYVIQIMARVGQGAYPCNRAMLRMTICGS